jgi:hypothetical protein
VTYRRCRLLYAVALQRGGAPVTHNRRNSFDSRCAEARAPAVALGKNSQEGKGQLRGAHASYKIPEIEQQRGALASRVNGKSATSSSGVYRAVQTGQGAAAALQGSAAR